MNKKIVWYPASKNTAIRQMYYRGVEYALVSRKNEQCHPFIFCKDFLHDVIYSCLNKEPINIYDFSFNEKNPIPELNKIKLLFTNSKDKFLKDKIPNIIDFINQIESYLKIKKTVVFSCPNPPLGYEKSGVFLFEGSKRWLKSPPMLSLYSLMLRIGINHQCGKSFLETIENIKSEKIKPFQKQDLHYLKNSEIAFSKILSFGDRKIFFRNITQNYPSMDIKDVHNKLGIIHFSRDCVRIALGLSVLVPAWHSKIKA